MKRSVLSLSLSAALALAASSALADQFSGEITQLDRGSKSIEVQGGEAQRRLRFFLARGGEVTREGKAVEFAELKRGDHVAIEFSRRGATQTARSVAVLASGAADELATRE